MGKLIVSILFSVIAATAHAALVIDYTGEEKTTKSVAIRGSEIKTKNLLLDNSILWATFVDSEKCIDKVVSGSGSNLSLTMALRILTPSGWKVYADDGVVLDDAFVSWRSGALWTKVIADAAERYRFQVVFNCGTKELTINNKPDLGVLDSESKLSNSDVGDLFKGVNESTNGVDENPETAELSVQEPVGVKKSNQAEFNSQSIEPVAYGNESVSAYLERYARHYGFSRVAYRFKNTNQDKLLRSLVAASKEKTFSSFLNANKLIQINGSDLVTNEGVMVISDDIVVTGNTNVKVYPVATGLLSTNAIEMATALGYSIGESNKWPNERLETDYKVPFGYDIVLTEAIDGFSQLFSNYPVQARFVMGSKNIFVVKRNTANRK